MSAPSLFNRLKQACDAEWMAYVDHPFVRSMADGTLPEGCFRHYLSQDYLFLIHFARAYALAVYKSDTLAEMRQAATGMGAILDEMGLHVKYCEKWGIPADEIAALPEAKATMAYTRYVLEKGLSGDLLDLHVALAPCVIGYAEIGLALKDRMGEGDHLYRDWMEQYASEDYQAMARSELDEIDRLFERRAGEGRFDSLVTTFRQATILEADFWQMGLDRSW